MEYPCVFYGESSIEDDKVFYKERDNQELPVYAKAKEMQEEGLIEIVKYYNNYNIEFPKNFKIQLTGKGEIFNENNSAVIVNTDRSNTPMKYFLDYTEDVTEITGIKFNESKTNAEVEYKTKIINVNPFQELYNFTLYGRISKKVGEEQSYSIKMSFYDDGWRIDSDVKKPKRWGGSIEKYKGAFGVNESKEEKEALSKNTDAGQKLDLPFIGKKYFENSMVATNYVVDIKSDGTTVVTAGGPGMDNNGSTIYKGEYKPIMRGKEEGIKIENGILYLLDANGAVSNGCAGDTPCKFSIKTESLIQ